MLVYIKLLSICLNLLQYVYTMKLQERPQIPSDAPGRQADAAGPHCPYGTRVSWGCVVVYFIHFGMYMYICTYIYIYVNIYIYIHIFIYVYMVFYYLYIYICMHIYASWPEDGCSSSKNLIIMVTVYSGDSYQQDHMSWLNQQKQGCSNMWYGNWQPQAWSDCVIVSLYFFNLLEANSFPLSLGCDEHP